MRRNIAFIIFMILLIYLSVGLTKYTQPGQIGKEITFDRFYKDFPVTFSHKTHVKDYDLQCSACHTTLFSMVKSDLTIVMRDFKEGKTCGACHTGGKAFAPIDNCTLCHNVETYESISFHNRLDFSHYTHVEGRKAQCDECHDKLFKMEISQPPYLSSEALEELFEQEKLCGECHNGVKAYKHIFWD